MTKFNLAKFNVNKHSYTVNFRINSYSEFGTELDSLLIMEQLLEYIGGLNTGSRLEIDTDACTVKVDGIEVMDYTADFAQLLPGINNFLVQASNPLTRLEYKIEYIDKFY